MLHDNEKSSERIFAEWIDHYSEKLLNRAYYMISNREDAKDLVQDVFTVAYARFETYEVKSSPYTWLSAILHNKVMDAYRVKYRFDTTISFDSFFSEHGEWTAERAASDWDQPESQHDLDNEDFNVMFDSCIENLPTKWKIVVKQSYLQQEATHDICRDLDMSRNNYWKILQRSRLQLRDCIDHNWSKFNY